MTGSHSESLIMAERLDEAYDGLMEATDIAEDLLEDESTGVPALHLLVQLQREIERVHRRRREPSQAKAARSRAEEYRRQLPRPPRMLDNLRR